MGNLQDGAIEGPEKCRRLSKSRVSGPANDFGLEPARVRDGPSPSTVIAAARARGQRRRPDDLGRWSQSGWSPSSRTKTVVHQALLYQTVPRQSKPEARAGGRPDLRRGPFSMLAGKCALDYAVDSQRSSMIGRHFRLFGLTSDRGRSLNGRLVEVIGRQEPPGTRLIVRFVEDDAAARILVEVANLQSGEFGNFDARRPDPIPEPDLRRMFSLAIKSHQNFGRPDVVARIALIRRYINGEQLGPIRCMDTLCPKDIEDPLVRGLQQMRIACTGNGLVSFDQFNEGLYGNGTSCAICLEQIPMNSLKVVGFPCLHVFHDKCAEKWLANNDHCPTCRYQLPLAGSLYDFDGPAQCLIRIKEWFISGMCQRCQANFQERDPLVMCGENLVPRSQLPRNVRYGPT